MTTWMITFTTGDGEIKRDRVKGGDEGRAAEAFMLIYPDAMIEKIEVTIG